MALKQFILLLIVSAALGLGGNLIHPNQIAFIGEYRELSTGDGPIVPPDAAEGDPPFIDINTAYMEYTTNTAQFIDARDEYEFKCGTIPGSINIPFEYMPEDLGPYFDSVLADVDEDETLVVFCSGEECDLSLHLARNLQAFGYDNVEIFFGGAREWQNAGFELERREDCGA